MRHHRNVFGIKTFDLLKQHSTYAWEIDDSVTRMCVRDSFSICFNCDMDCMTGGRYLSYSVCVSLMWEYTSAHIPDRGRIPTEKGPEELCPNSLDPAYSSPD